MAAFDIRK